MFKQLNEKDHSKVLVRFNEHDEILNNKNECNKCYLRTNYGINNIPIVVKTTHDYTNNKNLYYSYKLDIQYTEVLTRYLENLINISLTVCNNSLEKCVNIKHDILIICEAIIKTSKKAQTKLDENNKNELIIITNKINYYSAVYILFKLDYYMTNLKFNKINIDENLIINKNKIKTYIDNKVFDLVYIKKIETESSQIYNNLINNNPIIETFDNTQKINNNYLIIIILIIIFFLFFIIN